MTIADIAVAMNMNVAAGDEHLGNEVRSGYVSDMLSDVMGNAPQGAVWVTTQVHANVVAVAMLLDLAAVIVAAGNKPNPDALARAQERGVVVLTSELPAFEVVGRLYATGVRGAE